MAATGVGNRMWARREAVLSVVLAVGACSQQFINSQHPEYTQADFDRDSYQCRRENTHQTFVMYRGTAIGGADVNESMAAACMQARGWQPYNNAASARATPPPVEDGLSALS